jgi:DNA-binding NarL/FixJ family response regulator
MNILIAEDEPVTALSLRRFIEMSGDTVTAVCRTGEETVKICRLLQPDMIIMDVHLEGEINGISARKLIFDMRHLPVLFISATQDRDSLNEIESFKGSLFLKKPFSRNKLQDAIDQLMKVS